MTGDLGPSVSTPLDPACLPRRSDFVLSYSVGDELVLYAPDSGQAVSLNRSAGAVWNLCDGDKSLLDISALLAEWSGCSGCDIMSDIMAAVAHLRQSGLVELAGAK